MADTEHEPIDEPPAPHVGKGKGKGKLPVPHHVDELSPVMWLVVIVVGVGAGYLITKKLKSMPQASPPTAAPVDANANGQDHSGGAVFPTVTGPTTDKPKTNGEWIRVATDFLVAGGQPGTIVGSALTKFIQGKKVTPQEAAIVNMAVARFGWPPDGAPPLDVDTSGGITPPPTTAPTDPASLSNEDLLTAIEHYSQAGSTTNPGPYTAEAVNRVTSGRLAWNNNPIWKANGQNGNLGQGRYAAIILAPMLLQWIQAHPQGASPV